jgi:hypothetical protein
MMVVELEKHGKGHCCDMKTMYAMITLIWLCCVRMGLRDASTVRLGEVSELFLCKKSLVGKMDHLRDCATEKGMPEPGR